VARLLMELESWCCVKEVMAKLEFAARYK